MNSCCINNDDKNNTQWFVLWEVGKLHIANSFRHHLLVFYLVFIEKFAFSPVSILKCPVARPLLLWVYKWTGSAHCMEWFQRLLLFHWYVGFKSWTKTISTLCLPLAELGSGSKFYLNFADNLQQNANQAYLGQVKIELMNFHHEALDLYISICSINVKSESPTNKPFNNNPPLMPWTFLSCNGCVIVREVVTFNHNELPILLHIQRS